MFSVNNATAFFNSLHTYYHYFFSYLHVYIIHICVSGELERNIISGIPTKIKKVTKADERGVIKKTKEMETLFCSAICEGISFFFNLRR